MAKIRVRAPAALTGERRDRATRAAMRAMMRAARHGWKAVEGPNNCYFVPSVTQPRRARTVQFSTGVDGVLWGWCSCPGSFWRTEMAEEPLPITCWHCAAALGLLLQQRRIDVSDGLPVWKRPR